MERPNGLPERPNPAIPVANMSAPTSPDPTQPRSPPYPPSATEFLRFYRSHWSGVDFSSEERTGPEACHSVTLDFHRDRIHGYPQLARHMGEKEAHAIFRRFAALNARMLLYRQAELLELEKELDLVERKNWADPNNRTVCFSTAFLRDEHLPGSGPSKQWEIISLISNKLQQYSNIYLPPSVRIS